MCVANSVLREDNYCGIQSIEYDLQSEQTRHYRDMAQTTAELIESITVRVEKTLTGDYLYGGYSSMVRL